MNLKDSEVICFDVDNVLILWDITPHTPEHIVMNDGYKDVSLLPHKKHIQRLKELSLDHTIVIWSAAGKEWAESVINELQIGHFVDVIITKPHTYFDAAPADDWMTRKYIPVGDENVFDEN